MLRAFIKSFDSQHRQQWIEEAAYFRAKARNFETGHEAEDWLAAEQDYLTMLVNLQLNVLEEDGTITTMGLRQIAESLDIDHPELMRSELELIRAIQDATHHRACFQTEQSSNCQENDCHWKPKCKRLIAIWHR
ncbi:hypothetical protein DOJK_02386 [Patescibacteria group bacterium]|nr:hypothetical protein DOJK_02386 [Patescibacteria group bacterium]